MIRYTVTKAKPRGKQYHGPGHARNALGLSRYHESNSIRGALKAARGGYAWHDIDVMTTRDDVIIANHSFGVMSKEHFHAPGVPNRPVDQLTWEQIRALNGPNGHKIQRIETMFATHARLGTTGIALELKGDGREGWRLVQSPDFIDYLIHLANTHKVPIYFQADGRKRPLRRALRWARERGVWTRYTGSPVFSRPVANTPARAA